MSILVESSNSPFLYLWGALIWEQQGLILRFPDKKKKNRNCINYKVWNRVDILYCFPHILKAVKSSKVLSVCHAMVSSCHLISLQYVMRWFSSRLSVLSPFIKCALCYSSSSVSVYSRLCLPCSPINSKLLLKCVKKYPWVFPATCMLGCNDIHTQLLMNTFNVNLK